MTTEEQFDLIGLAGAAQDDRNMTAKEKALPEAKVDDEKAPSIAKVDGKIEEDGEQKKEEMNCRDI